jgi:hypothetical protein
VTFLAAFLVSFVYIFLKATQQRHVQFAQYFRMPIPSYGMAACEVFVIGTVARGEGLAELAVLAFCIGTGAWMGSVLGTWMHARRT